jgi:hypothetical protein
MNLRFPVKKKKKKKKCMIRKLVDKAVTQTEAAQPPLSYQRPITTRSDDNAVAEHDQH